MFFLVKKKTGLCLECGPVTKMGNSGRHIILLDLVDSSLIMAARSKPGLL